MLQALAIRDVVLIDRLDLSFERGLSVLTGETGAGKSILLDALGLALGARGDAGLVRKGAATATVTACFEPTAKHPVRALLDEHGIEADGQVILRRSLGADGRSRAFVNDQPASVGLLRQISALLVEVHGQFDNQGLLDTANHRAALDAFAGHGDAVAQVGALYTAWRAAHQAEADAREQAARAVQDADFLRHALEELDALDPRPGEEAELAEQRAMLGGREKLIEALNGALADLAAHKGVEGSLRAAQRQLERVSPQAAGRLDAAIAALDRAAVETVEAVAQIEAFGASLDRDPQALERAEERLFALRALARKHRVEVDALAALRTDVARRLAAIDDRDGHLAALAKATAAARAQYLGAAEALSKAREAAAERLGRAIARELPPLKLEKARFRARRETLPETGWNAEGIDRVVFEVATNPGSDPGPIDRIASGGELARFMLALKVVLARSTSAPTLIFDEVDAGLGGAAAAAVGERLARLARDVQVLVVTHSPQVAARGSHHWRVAKSSRGTTTTTTVENLDPAARREEIARMLSGASITAAARAAADSLLRGESADEKTTKKVVRA
ncbi:MAG TPA: DNA repair protein RecN [Alphaproteobacteria bacterium]|nr:DNA repair protein RecN [Alphaproteobacteria bacterium]